MAYWHHYFVNQNAQISGEHEVHKEGCPYLPAPSNRVNLGLHEHCSTAVAEARRCHYRNVDGCFWCCNDCHTR